MKYCYCINRRLKNKNILNNSNSCKQTNSTESSITFFECNIFPPMKN